MTVQSIYQSFLTFANGWSPILYVEKDVMGIKKKKSLLLIFSFVNFLSCKYYMMMFYFLFFALSFLFLFF